MIRRITIILLALCAISPAVAQRRDTLSSIERTALADDAVTEVVSLAYDASVAASALRRRVSLSSLALRYDMRREQEAMLQQEGDGVSLGSVEAKSYKHLNSRSTVEANASYRFGVKNNVCWNSSSDYRLLAPYITADSIGGNLDTEQYKFGGSYAYRGERFTYGVGAEYRALHEWREVDPRPRNITSDLQAQIAGGYNFERYMLGLSASVRIYNQDHNVTYYNVKGANTSQLPMTGLGTYYDRFAGAVSDYLSYEFKGAGYSAALQLVPREADGWRAMAGYTSLRIKRDMPQYSNITLTTLRTETFSAMVGYGTTTNSVRWAVGVEGNVERRRGDENVLNTSSLSKDMVLATFTMYDSYAAEASVTAAVEWLFDWGYLFVRPRAGVENLNSGYRYPERRMSFLMVEGGADVGARYQSEKWLADIAVGGGYATALNSTLFLPASAERAIADMVRRQWAGITADRVLIDAKLSAQRAINRRLSIYVAGVWQMYNRNIGAGHIASVECGIRF